MPGIRRHRLCLRTAFTATASTDIGTGDLPASSSINILEEAGAGASGSGLCSYDATYDLPNGDEGRAMMQIVHDVAPGAHLAFYTAVNSEADMATGIKALAAAGAKVIADDVTYFDEPFFQDGLIAQAVDSVNASGVAYFSAAGNNGAIGYDNLAPTFATPSTMPAGEQLLNFDTTGATTTTALTAKIPPLPPGDFVAIVLEWDQPYVTGSPNSGGATSQMDLCLTGTGTGLVARPGQPRTPTGARVRRLTSATTPRSAPAANSSASTPTRSWSSAIPQAPPRAAPARLTTICRPVPRARRRRTSPSRWDSPEVPLRIASSW